MPRRPSQLRMARLSAGLSLREAAVGAGWGPRSQSILHRIERGQIECPEHRVQPLADALGVDKEELETLLWVVRQNWLREQRRKERGDG